MNTSGPKPDPGAKGAAIMHEADIGSGERSPAQQETDQMIKEIPPLPPGGKQPSDSQDNSSGR